MEYNLEDKSVLVTGSTRGIGLEIAKKFLISGSKVTLNGRNAKNLKENSLIFKNKNQVFIPADVSSPDGAKFLIEETIRLQKKIDIVICNVGSGQSVPPGKENFNEWQRVFANNFFSTTNIIENAKNKLKETKGSIICISSICGHEIITNAPLTYSTAKCALNFYIKGIARKLGEDGIRINGISPGNIMFEGSSWERKLLKEPDKVYKMLKKNVPLSKFGSPQDIANLCIWLSSKEASFCTGSIFRVDGGQLRV